jgi:hypothetical protein
MEIRSNVYEQVILTSQYFPPVSYFALLVQFGKILIEASEHYRKQSYRNRCLIRGANKIEKLIVPVKHPANHPEIRDIRIDYSTNWFKLHRKALLSAYGKSPFYEFFADDFFHILDKKHRFLFDLNMEILPKCLDLLGIEQELTYANHYIKTCKPGIFDARDLIDPKKPDKNRLFFKPVPYYQVFGKNFAENLSIIDLLFCEGPNALQIIKQSALFINEC